MDIKIDKERLSKAERKSRVSPDAQKIIQGISEVHEELKTERADYAKLYARFTTVLKSHIQLQEEHKTFQESYVSQFEDLKARYEALRVKYEGDNIEAQIEKKEKTVESLEIKKKKKEKITANQAYIERLAKPRIVVKEKTRS